MSSAPVELDQIQGTLHPAGYRILLRIPRLQEQMKDWANLIRPEENRSVEEIAQLTGQVIEIGPDAYKDKNKFPNGPWCAVGDMVMIRAYAGTRFTLRDVKTGVRTLYALINDDTVQGVVLGDYEAIGRA